MEVIELTHRFACRGEESPSTVTYLISMNLAELNCFVFPLLESGE